jgi:hypothetical protein
MLGGTRVWVVAFNPKAELVFFSTSGSCVFIPQGFNHSAQGWSPPATYPGLMSRHVFLR